MNLALQQEIIKTALCQMLEGGHFNICVIDKILKMTGGIPPKAEYEALNLLHCTDWKAMSPALRLDVAKMIKVVVESQPMYLEVGGQTIAPQSALPTKKPNLLN